MANDLQDIGKQGLADAKADIQGWHWGVKLAVVAGSAGVLGIIAWTAFTGMYRSATTTTTLNASQMQIVQAEATKAAAAYTEMVDGRQVSGTLISCSGTDSDKPGSVGYGKVSCAVRLPQVKLVIGKDGNQVSTVLFADKVFQCTIPYKGVSGCKL